MSMLLFKFENIGHLVFGQTDLQKFKINKLYLYNWNTGWWISTKKNGTLSSKYKYLDTFLTGYLNLNSNLYFYISVFLWIFSVIFRQGNKTFMRSFNVRFLFLSQNSSKYHILSYYSSE